MVPNTTKPGQGKGTYAHSDTYLQRIMGPGTTREVKSIRRY